MQVWTNPERYCYPDKTIFDFLATGKTIFRITYLYFKVDDIILHANLIKSIIIIIVIIIVFIRK